jgi:hypothetical protein
MSTHGERYARSVVHWLQSLAEAERRNWLRILEASDANLANTVTRMLDAEQQLAMPRRRPLATSDNRPPPVVLISDESTSEADEPTTTTTLSTSTFIVIDDDDDDDMMPVRRHQQSIFLDLVSVDEEAEQEEAESMQVETPPRSPHHPGIAESIDIERTPSDAQRHPATTTTTTKQQHDDDDDPYASHMRYQSLMHSPITKREFDVWVASM